MPPIYAVVLIKMKGGALVAWLKLGYQKLKLGYQKCNHNMGFVGAWLAFSPGCKGCKDCKGYSDGKGRSEVAL